MTNVPAFYYSAVPASVLNDPTAYAISIFGLLGSNLVALEWLRQIIFRLVRYPHKVFHPVTLYRASWAAMLIGILLRSGPDVLQITLWPDILPATRFAYAHWNRLLDGVSFFPMAAAFALASTTMRLDETQIAKEPIPTDLWPTKTDRYRAVLAFALLTFISIAIAFR